MSAALHSHIKIKCMNFEYEYQTGKNKESLLKRGIAPKGAYQSLDDQLSGIWATFFSVTAVMASMWPLLATPSSASMTPHDIITHHTTAHDITTAERLKAGWHKKLWRTQCDTSTPKLKWPVWHYHAQIEVLAGTHRTCYQTNTLGTNDQHVWVRHGLFECVPCLENIQFWKFRMLAVLPSFSWVVKTTRDQA